MHTNTSSATVPQRTRPASQVVGATRSATTPIATPVAGAGKTAPHRADAFAEIAPMGSAARFRKSQTILCEGGAAERCFQVLRGVVRAYKMLPDGRRQIVDFLFPGEFFGLTADGMYGYSADAVTDATVLSFGTGVLERLAREKPTLARSLRDAAYREIRAAQTHIVLLGRKTAFERVASFLLALSRRGADTGHHDGSIVWVPMSQADIADYLGLTTETVNRVVSQLRETGLITMPSRGVMRLESPTELEEVACAA